MSPQSTLCERASFSCDDNSFKRFAYLSELVQATDASFSMHRRLDSEIDHLEQRPVVPIEACSNPFQLKKRKVSMYSNPSKETMSNYNADFLSAIFQDVAELIQEKESQIDPTSSMTVTLKKRRVSVASSLSRCSKSYACLSCSSSSHADINPNSEDDSVERVSETFPSSASFHDKDSFVLPNLPATVSENSCSVVNLTQTSVRAAQVRETPNFIFGCTSQSKDSYGWFVEIDDSPEDTTKIGHVPNAPKFKSKDDLSFTVCTAPKKNPAFDAALEWAKAADTVDNVLADLPF